MSLIKIKQVEGLQTALNNVGGGAAVNTKSFKYTLVAAAPTNPGDVELNGNNIFRLNVTDSEAAAIAKSILDVTGYVIIHNVTAGTFGSYILAQFNGSNPLTQFHIKLESLDPVSNGMGFQTFTTADELTFYFIEGTPIINHWGTLDPLNAGAGGSGFIPGRIYQSVGSSTSPMKYCTQGYQFSGQFTDLGSRSIKYEESGFTSVDQGGGVHRTTLDNNFLSANGQAPYSNWYNDSSLTDGHNLILWINGLAVSTTAYYLQDNGGGGKELVVDTPYPIDTTDVFSIRVDFAAYYPA